MQFINDYIAIILYVTGAITAGAVLQFFFPAPMLKLLYRFEIKDEAGLYFARHWGLVVFSIGALLIYAASHPEARAVIMLFALIEKAGVVALAILHRNRPYAKALRGGAAFDAICVLLYGIYLIQ